MEFVDNVLPELPEYHPDSELRTRPGYYPNISGKQLECVRDFSRLINEAGLNCDDGKEIYVSKLLRFLRARNFNVQKAFDMIKADIEWRNIEDRHNLVDETSEQVLRCDPKLIYKYFPAWVQGYDKQCRPVSWRNFGKFEIWNILKLTTMDRIVRFHAWETEQLLRLMRDKSSETRYNIETFTVICDASGWHLGLATGDAYNFIKGMASTDSDHNPERLGKLIVINAPIMLSVAWRIIQGFIDNVTKDKINIFSDPKDWKPVLFNLIDKNQIPKQYGGDGPDPNPEDAYLSMEPPSYTGNGRSTEVTIETNPVETQLLSPSPVVVVVAQKLLDQSSLVKLEKIEINTETIS
eukprot:gene7775-15909_t